MDNIGPSVRNMMSRASGNEEQEESMCPKLTMQQRVIGFCICFGLGYLISFLAVMSLIKANEEGIRQFAILYIIGNIIALCGTAFLVGPKSHCKKMFHKSRRGAAAFYLLMLLVVLVAAVAGAHIILVLFLLLIQVCAAMWYMASYIPYGRRMIVSCLKAPFSGGNSSG
uniref:Vesicle transport protein n=1 Tax=Fibrocapsa japonica TaxID=94617 RepID=A0A7S2XXF0_9STRA|mmetsp:Transcript_21947/g.31860  ORF Transcript_21947/g.31860 Transcript_21947/m.31860 type:complete len:169 (+) Transcript_21947:85-591(+)